MAFYLGSHEVNPYGGQPQGGGGGSLKIGVIRPDAELVKRVSEDFLLVEDKSVSIPAYTTTTTTVYQNPDVETYEFDADGDYRHYVVQRALSYPIYNTTNASGGRFEYSIAVIAMEILNHKAADLTALDGTQCAAAGNPLVLSRNVMTEITYYNSSNVVAMASSTYGTMQTPNAPNLSKISGTTRHTIKVAHPNCRVRGNGTYYSQTYWEATTDIRYQWVLEIYRVPEYNLGVNGWDTQSMLSHAVDCAITASHTLT